MILKYIYLVCFIEIPVIVDGEMLICPSYPFYFTYDPIKAQEVCEEFEDLDRISDQCLYPNELRIHYPGVIVFDWNESEQRYNLNWDCQRGCHQYKFGITPYSLENLPSNILINPKEVFHRQLEGPSPKKSLTLALVYGMVRTSSRQRTQGCWFTILTSCYQKIRAPENALVRYLKIRIETNLELK